MFRYIFRAILGLIAIFLGTTVPAVITYKFLPVYVTPLMVIRYTENIIEGKMPKFQHKWVSYNKISKYMPLAVMAGEDQSFTNHHGFDFEAMKNAYENNKKGKRIHGGSTISQQTAKNVFLWPTRSYIRKGFEAYFTALIELFWSKRRIMQVYLNVIETGDGIYGVEAASEYYFNKNAANLSQDQAAAIAASLPNPRKFNPAKQIGYFSRHKNFILKYMSDMSVLK